MRHPFWIINSSLLALLFISLCFIVFSQQIIPTQKIATKRVSSSANAQQHIDVTVSEIYMNDLFNTYHEKVAPPEEPNYTKQIPQPPTPSTLQVPEEPKQPFLP